MRRELLPGLRLCGLDKRDQSLHVIKGFVPSLSMEFVGCRFADRCDRVMDICRQRDPGWTAFGEHRVYCHLYRDGIDDQDSVTAEPAERNHVARQATEQSLLKVTDLKVHFPILAGVFKHTVGQVKAVDGIDLVIPRGRTLALVGESGCGKTTAGKAILQLLRPTAGEVLFEDVDLCKISRNQLRQRRTDFQIIFQDPYSSMNPRMMVGDIVSEGMRALHLVDKIEQKEKVRALLQEVGLAADSIDRYPHEFSGGQRQRISIARALAVGPKLIICDEPTSALDVSVQAQILNLLQQLQREMAFSYLFITHNISVVAYLAHEVAVMYLGRIVERGPVAEILAQPQHPYTEALLSAVLTIDETTQREVLQLGGDIPSPADPPQGCHFHPRCPKVMDVCRTVYPEEHAVDATHQVRCHLCAN